MERPLSALDIHYLVKELQCLVNGKVEKVYQWGKEEFIFRVYNKDKFHLRISMDGLIHLTNKKYAAPKQPPGYCTFLRKHIQSSTINFIEQEGFERIIKIGFTNKNGSYLMITELFSPGNLIVCKDDLILHPLHRVKSNQRIIESKKPYEKPTSQTNTKELSDEEIIKMMDESTMETGRFVAVELGFGGFYSEIIISEANVSKETKTKDLKEAEKRRITEVVKEIFDKKIQSFRDEKSAYPFTVKELKIGKEYDSFNEALDGFYEVKEKEVVKKVKKDKTQNIIDAQTKTVGNLKKQIEEYQKAGDVIYEKYAEFKSLIMRSNKIAKEKGWETVAEELKKNDKIKNFDKKNKKVTLELND